MVYTLGFGQGFVIYHFHQRSRKKGSSLPIIWNVSSIMVPNVNHIYQVDDFWLGEMKNENIDVEIVIMINCGVFCQKVKKNYGSVAVSPDTFIQDFSRKKHSDSKIKILW